MDSRFNGRHPGTTAVLRHFRHEHLATQDLRDLSRGFTILAEGLVDGLPDSPELTVALRKLLEAKDCAVRALVDAEGIYAPNRVVPQPPIGKDQE